jgi:hypothetical protein
MKLFTTLATLLTFLFPQPNTQSTSHADPLKQLAFLEGTWQAKTLSGSAGGDVAGTYSFERELKGHVLARHTKSVSSCTGPSAYDCEHSDLLYIFAAPDRQSRKAINLDNEGHVLNYDVTAPTPTSAQFLSDSSTPGPQFRLVYELKSGVMSGRFQMRPPGQSDWKSYLEWSGEKR